VLISVVFRLIKEKDKIRKVKRNGVRVIGVIVYNEESNSNSMYRLGGNINTPIIKFVTEEGFEVTGKPIIGFISQHEISMMDKISIIYDRHNPEKFCVVEV
jgi:hypothetical protein